MIIYDTWLDNTCAIDLGDTCVFDLLNTVDDRMKFA